MRNAQTQLNEYYKNYDQRLYEELLKRAETDKSARLLLTKEFGEDSDRDIMIKGRDE